MNARFQGQPGTKPRHPEKEVVMRTGILKKKRTEREKKKGVQEISVVGAPSSKEGTCRELGGENQKRR